MALAIAIHSLSSPCVQFLYKEWLHIPAYAVDLLDGDVCNDLLDRVAVRVAVGRHSLIATDIFS